MKIGVSLANYGHLPSQNFIKNTAITIEELGLDSIWLSDHIIVPKNNAPWTRVFETLVTLGYLASITKKVQLGSSILLVPIREPFALAKQIATLDVLSNGRLMLGVGLGWNKKEFELLGYDFANRKRLFELKLHTLKKIWNGHYLKEGFLCEPMPTASGGPPILIGGQSKDALRYVASIGDGWHPVGITPSQYEDGIRMITKLKKQNYIWSLRINIAVNRSLAQTYVGADGSSRVRLAGKLDEIISSIQEYHKIGLHHLVCDIRANSQREYIRQLRYVAEIKRSF